MDTTSILLTLACEAETEALAARLAALSGPGDVIALHGDLGAGKTAFARAFIRARSRPHEEVPSPTFTLVQVYDPVEADDAAGIWHFDLFRLAAAEDALELGIDDAFASGISLVEWPERLGPLLPQHRLEVTLAAGPTENSRRLRIEAGAEWWQRLNEAGLG